MEGKDYKTDQNCFPLARSVAPWRSCSLALLLLLISGSLLIYLSLSISLSLLTDLQLCVLELRGLLLQENKHFIIIIWTQSVSYSVRCLLERNCHNNTNKLNSIYFILKISTFSLHSLHSLNNVILFKNI